jgi:hypothetical protein
MFLFLFLFLAIWRFLPAEHGQRRWGARKTPESPV